MSTPTFKTFWTIDEQRVDDIDDVAELVEAGRVAVEVPAEKQARDYEMRQLQERWHRESLDRYEKYAAESAHKDSPEGKRELVARHAAEHSGGIVTTTGRNPVFDELDRYSPPNTDVFKQ